MDCGGNAGLLAGRTIAASVGVDHKTVAIVRDASQERGEIPHVSATTAQPGAGQPQISNSQQKNPASVNWRV